MEVTRKQVPLNDLAEFDRRIGPSYDKALAAIDSFMKFQRKCRPTTHHTDDETVEDDETGIEMQGKFLIKCDQ